MKSRLRWVNLRGWVRDARLFMRIYARNLEDRRQPFPASDKVILGGLFVAFFPAAWLFYRYRREEIDRHYTTTRRLEVPPK